MLPIIISAIENPDDRDLMTEFYVNYKSLLFSEAKKHLDNPEDIEDTVYEALARVIDKMPIFRNLKPWQRVQYVVTTVRNLAYILRKRNRYFTMVPFEELEYEIPEGDDSSVEQTVEKALIKKYIMNIWQQIELEDRMLLEQKYILRWSDEELADALGIKPQSVRMRLTRAKRSVLSELKNKGLDLSSLI